jgi:hypothetical protein
MAAAVEARVGIARECEVGAGELYRAAPLLWREGLSSPNREVRVHVLSLFTVLAPAWTAASSGLLADDLDALAKGAPLPALRIDEAMRDILARCLSRAHLHHLSLGPQAHSRDW